MTQNSTADQINLAYETEVDLADGIIQTCLQLTETPPPGIIPHGIVFRFQDLDNFYGVGFSDHNNLILGRMRNGTPEPLIAPISGFTSTDPHHFKIVLEGDRVQVYVALEGQSYPTTPQIDVSIPELLTEIRTGKVGIGTYAVRAEFGPVWVDGASLPDSMTWSAWPECPVCSASNAVGWAGGPINTRNGNLSYQETDLVIPVKGESLAFRRAYASEAVDVYTTTLGYGWTHNYAMRLHVGDDMVELQAPGGSRLPFFDNGDGSYSPYAGVTAELVYDDGAGEYTVTGFNQATYIFNDQGQLVEQVDPFGNSITFTYDNGRLAQAAQGSRYLTYSYDQTSGRLIEVGDNLSRTVSLNYDGNGDLVSVTKPLDLISTYEYSGTTHLLTKVTDPSGRIIEETAYDGEGRAYRQWDGEGNLLVEIDFSQADRRVVVENGVIMTHTYDLRGTLVDVTYGCVDNAAGCGAGTAVGYDSNFKQNSVLDANGNPTGLAWNAGGSNLEGVTDALNNHTQMVYDSFNNLVQTVDARDQTTTFHYDDPNLPTFRTRVTDSLSNTTTYTPTAAGLLAAEEDPTGRITTYAYSEFGQVIETVRAAGTSQAITTTYGYDGVGRLITTTQASAAESSESTTSLNVYDDGDRLLATITNWTGSDPDQWQQDCDTSPGPRDSNVCTRYGYDDAGRTISTTNGLNQTNLTFYDDAGRSFLSVTNYDGAPFNEADPAGDLCPSPNPHAPSPTHNLCSLTGYDQFGRVVTSTGSLGRLNVTEYDSLGRVSRSVSNWVNGSFDANYPDQDIETRYQYDAVGNTVIVTDTLGFMTRTFYDPLNRVKGTITNWRGSIDDINDLPDCLALPHERDYDICTLYEFDEVGNTIIVTDTLGQMTRTFYDELNRVEATVANWNSATLTTPAECVLAADNENDENVCTLYGYDAAGNQVTTTNALNQTSLTVYDAANRPFITVQNWDGTLIEAENDCSFPPAQPDTNLCSVTYFDSLGRRSASRDPMGHLTEFAYDGLGRVITTTRYLDSQPVITVTTYDALGNRLSQADANEHTTLFTYDSLNRLQTTISAEGMAITRTYNAAGWLLTTTNSLSHQTVNQYDQLGRTVATTDGEANTTAYEYDGRGNQTAMIDAEAARTTYQYDGLNRLVGVIENDTGGSQTADSNVLTQYRYDALGNRTVITNALNVTSTLTVYDALNRPIIVEDALGHQTHTQYNALGHRTVLTDANGAVTTYQYDGLNRLVETNYLADGETVSTSYDALGNRTAMTDTLGLTSYIYDSLSRPITITDPFTGTVGYGYDPVGNRTDLFYPDGKVVTYTYDMDNRLVQVEDWAEGVTAYEYDAAGRLITTTLPNGVVTTNQYDNANRLTQLAHHDPAAEVLLADYHYQLDGVGNRVAATETVRLPATLQLLAETVVAAGFNDQSQPAVSYNPDDNQYLVVWQDASRLPVTIQGQRLAGDGSLIGSSFTIATSGANPAVAYSPVDESYLVVWQTTTDILARPVAADGTPGTTFTVFAGTTTSPAAEPAIAYSAAHDYFLVAWQRLGGGGMSDPPPPYLIQSQFVWPSGTVRRLVTIAQQATPLAQPFVSTNDDINLITWQDARNTQTDIYGQRLNYDSSLAGSNFVINGASGDKSWPAAAWNDNAGAYLVTWQHDGNGHVLGQRIDTDGDPVGTPIILSHTGQATRPALVTTAAGQWLAAWQEGNDLYGRLLNSDGSLDGQAVSLVAEKDSQSRPALAGGQEVQALVVWQDDRDGDEDIYSGPVVLATVLQTTTIDYDYDPLYRLVEASYTGAITATYSYVYDSVGNMTAYTETIGAETSSTSRTFNAANQLLVSLDSEAGTTSFYYDNTGNLTQTLPPGVNPGEAGEQVYSFNQRNLLTGTQLGAGSSVYDAIAEYIYDGDGNRAQQIDHTGSQPLTITYTNDNTGLSQVLVSDDGTSQTTNLLGLSLIQQDNGSEIRTLLNDGPGSVRQEMVDAAIESTTTYEPFGNLLVQTGLSGTTYGFTGEQHDAAAGLVYLRARYYNPNLKVFMSRDPFPGWPTLPASQHGYSYVHNNPVNWVDPAGLLVCEAPQTGCAEWVQYALNKIENVPLPIGRMLVQALRDKDRSLQGLQLIFTHTAHITNECFDPSLFQPSTRSDMPGFRIKFTDDFPWLSRDAAMAVRPTSLYVKLRYFNPPEPPSDAAVLLFAHELVHVMQGPVLAYSIVGEVQAYQVQAALRRHLHDESEISSSLSEKAIPPNKGNFGVNFGNGKKIQNR
jgi:RHS repeat-associated protein